MGENNLITLQITPEQAEYFRLTYENRISELRSDPTVQEYLNLLTVVANLEKTLHSSRIKPTHQDIKKNIVQAFNPMEYSPKWYIWQKAQYAIRTARALLTTREILDRIVKYEPNFYESTKLDFDKAQKNIASTLKQKIDLKQVFFRQKNASGEFTYGLIENQGVYKNDIIQQTMSV